MSFTLPCAASVSSAARTRASSGLFDIATSDSTDCRSSCGAVHRPCEPARAQPIAERLHVVAAQRRRDDHDRRRR